VKAHRTILQLDESNQSVGKGNSRGTGKGFGMSPGLQFFLYEIAARVVAFYLSVDTFRELRNGLAEGKIRVWSSSLLVWRTDPIDREAAPWQFWAQVVTRIIALIAGVFVMIFGWYHPNS
jgi:hypothetical protein